MAPVVRRWTELSAVALVVLRKYQSQVFGASQLVLQQCDWPVYLLFLFCWSLSCVDLYFSLPVEYEMIVIIPALQRAQ